MSTSFRYTPKVAKAFGLEEKDIHPSDKCLVLTRNQKKMVPFGYKTNNLILNARQETLLEKPLFKDSMHCIVPAGSFYEWDLGKKKWNFIAITFSILQEFLLMITLSLLPRMPIRM